MIYCTGDIHGDLTELVHERMHKIKSGDTIVILGDAGLNYYGLKRGDASRKKRLQRRCEYERKTVFCIHGNHEMRPQTIPTYKTKEWNGGVVFYEEDCPDILFAKDGEVYDMDGEKAIVIGGAYSVDKFYRLERGYEWFSDEQPDDETKAAVEAKLDSMGWKVDLVLSHTCPLKYQPLEAYLPNIDQSLVDRSTEEWLDTIEDRLAYKHWLCGHWHIDKYINNKGKDITFLFKDVRKAARK